MRRWRAFFVHWQLDEVLLHVQATMDTLETLLPMATALEGRDTGTYGPIRAWLWEGCLRGLLTIKEFHDLKAEVWRVSSLDPPLRSGT